MRIIGVDESGKGDFFGPLVVAALVADSEDEPRLQKLGVRDSKKLTDKRILEIAADLQRDFVHAVIVIGPEKYNQLYAKIKNLNKLLGWGHARAIENCLDETHADLAISDKFGDPKRVTASMTDKSSELELRLMVRGESILQVAAASIIARATFVKQIKRLSEKYGVELPKGAAAHVDTAGRTIVKKYGPEILPLVAKIHFKNYQRATMAVSAK